MTLTLPGDTNGPAEPVVGQNARDPGVEDVIARELKIVRDAVTALENGVSQDISPEAYGEAYWAASRLRDAADDLAERIAEEEMD